VMSKFGAKQIVLCGFSYGSWITASCATARPDITLDLVLCDGRTGMSEADPDEPELSAFRVRYPSMQDKHALTLPQVYSRSSQDQRPPQRSVP
jgi:pimeloyl-ACP methyl ester carboxylesterase